MLDVGCGTGHVCFAFSGRFRQIMGIDPSHPMLVEAESIASAQKLTGFTFHQLKAEDLPGDLGLFQLITFGQSFHRTAQERMTDIVYRMLEPEGGLALFFASVPWRGEAPWKEVMRRIVKKWTDSTIGGSFVPSQGIIGQSVFGTYENFRVQEEYVWSAPDLIGFLFSTSFCSRSILGSRADAFARDLTTQLLNVQPDGRFQDQLETTVVLARKP